MIELWGWLKALAPAIEADAATFYNVYQRPDGSWYFVCAHSRERLLGATFGMHPPFPILLLKVRWKP